MGRISFLFLICALTVTCLSPSAKAIAPFKKAFQTKYVNPSDNASLKAAFKKASCNTCHVKGKKKTTRNAYGEELSKLIEGNANKRIKEAGKDGKDARKAMQAQILKELDEVFDKVGKMPSGDGEPSYDDLIQSGQLPVPLPK